MLIKRNYNLKKPYQISLTAPSINKFVYSNFYKKRGIRHVENIKIVIYKYHGIIKLATWQDHLQTHFVYMTNNIKNSAYQSLNSFTFTIGTKKTPFPIGREKKAISHWPREKPHFPLAERKKPFPIGRENTL